MKKIVFIAIVAILFTACSENTKKTGENAEQATEATEATDIEEIAVVDFEKAAASFVGKEVKIKGIVDHVCKHGGKKLLLVGDGASLHAYAEERIDEEVVGSEIILAGIVEEKRIDEATCLQMEEDCMNSHKEGVKTDDEMEATKHQVEFYRDSMKTAGVEHLSFYSVKYVSHEIVEQKKLEE